MKREYFLSIKSSLHNATKSSSTHLALNSCINMWGKTVKYFILILETNQENLCIDECEENFKHIANPKTMNGNCSIKCVNNCKIVYPKLRVRDMKMKYNGNTSIIIEYKEFRQLVYKAEPSGNLINLFCDLGGIFGLYFGIALMDFNKIFELILQKLRVIINLILVHDKFNFVLKFKVYIFKLKIFIQYMGKIRWNILTYGISAPILFTQLYSIIYTYFQYTTETTYEFIPYIRSDNSYSINEFPAITICNENLLEKIIFDKHYNIDQIEYLNTLYDQLKKDHRLTYGQYIQEIFVLAAFVQHRVKGMRILWTNYNQDIRILMTLTDYINHYFSYYLPYRPQDFAIFSKMSDQLVDLFGAYNYSDFKAKMNRFEDKHLYGLKPLQKLMNFYSDHYQCIVQSIPSHMCSHFGQTLKLLSPLGKCHTYLSSTNVNHTLVRNIMLQNDQFTLYTYGASSSPSNSRRFPNYLQKYIYLHDRNSIVSIDSHLSQTDHIGQLDEPSHLGIILKKVNIDFSFLINLHSILESTWHDVLVKIA